MYNLKNIAFAITGYEDVNRRLPASGSHGVWPDGTAFASHSWAVSILPWVDHRSVLDRWNLDKPFTDSENIILAKTHVAAYICPQDLSRSPKDDRGGDLSYVVNGGVAFSVRRNGVDDCQILPSGSTIDLNGDSLSCTGHLTDDEDRRLFKRMGMFFIENWKSDITTRFHQLADAKDGLSQTFLASENARTGYQPGEPSANFADPNPYRCAFYIGNPCPTDSCTPGGVDYSLSNSGSSRINSGLSLGEGDSTAPNSFHEGGVFMSFGDAHCTFLSEQIDGQVYAALASPQGLLLDGTPLVQAIVSGNSF